MRKLSFSLACLVLSIAPALQAQTDMGTVDIGSNATASVTATILHPGTLSSISVTTGGNTNLDFTSTGGTCKVGDPHAAADTCTIEVTFAPTLAGQRFGGFLLMNQDGSIAAQGYLHGTGRGPQITYMPGTRTQLLNNIVVPNGLATDSGSNIYAVEGAWQSLGDSAQTNGLVAKLPGSANGTTPFTSGTAPSVTQFPTNISVDGAGNTYLIDTQDWQSVLLANNSYIAPNAPSSIVSADAAGNLYKSCADGLCKETLQPDGTYLEGTVTTMSNLTIYFIDASGDVFAGQSASMLYEFIPTPAGYVAFAGSTGTHIIDDLSADGLGNIYAADSNGNVYKETPQSDGTATQTFLFNNVMTQYTTNRLLIDATDGGNRLAADPAGNLYFWANTSASSPQVSNPNIGAQTYPLYGLFEENYSLPSTLNFDPTAQNSVSGSQVVTITNSGNMPLQFSTIAFPSDFKEGNSAGECTEGTSLVANESCTLTVQFAPVATLSGPSAQLSEQVLVATNVHNAPGTQQAIMVTGTESPSTLATISFSPAALAFPSTFPGTTSAPVTITVSNTSAVAASVSSYKFTGTNASEFSLFSKTCGYSLPAHSSCTLTYLFKPTVSGPATATLVATDNAFGAPQSMPVSGTGTAIAAISFSPPSLTFPATKAGTSSAPQLVTVTNPSALPLAVTSYVFSGANAGEFTLAGKTCVTVLAANSSCTLSIVFKPTATGPASASILATDSAFATPQGVPLSGTAQ
jgi:hypothetical protein